MKSTIQFIAVCLCFCTTNALPRTAAAADPIPVPTEADFAIPDYRFASGQTLPQLKIHYRTLGTIARDPHGSVLNAVLILHGTTGSGNQFFNADFAGELFGPGRPLDATRYFLILPDDIDHGKSGKPSDGLHAKFPNYRYADMVDAEHRLVVDGLKIARLRLVMGTSMGGMHTWMWGENYPGMVDALMPLASLPSPIAGRNRMWRRIISETIRTDPDWLDGEYKSQPHSLRQAAEMLFFMGDNPKRRAEQCPTGKSADEALDAAADRAMKSSDANDMLYAVESSADYDPSKKLESIQAPLVAVNSADDLINPPDQGILEKEIKRVPRGRAVLIPEGPDTRGHGTHTVAKVWKDELVKLLKETEKV